MSSSHPHSPGFVAGLIGIGVLLLGPALSVAQDAVLEPQIANLIVQIDNPSHDDPVRASRVEVRAPGATLETIAESGAVTGEIVFPDVPVYNFKPYVVTAWVEDVAYHTQHSGQEFLDGKPAVVYAFDATDATDGVTVTGMNIVVRQREGGFSYEAILTTENRSSPQRTVRASARPVRLALPDGLTGATVEVLRGPEPVDARLDPGAQLTGVEAALPPGPARITIKGLVPAERELRFDVACNLPVEAWSLMTWPSDLRVTSIDLSADRSQDYAGFARWRGRALTPNDRVDVDIAALEAAAPAPVFAEVPSSDETRSESEERELPIPWVTVIAATVMVALYLIWKLRR